MYFSRCQPSVRAPRSVLSYICSDNNFKYNNTSVLKYYNSQHILKMFNLKLQSLNKFLKYAPDEEISLRK